MGRTIGLVPQKSKTKEFETLPEAPKAETDNVPPKADDTPPKTDDTPPKVKDAPPKPPAEKKDKAAPTEGK